MTTQSTKGGPGTALQEVAPSPGVAKYDPELAALAEQYAGQGSEEMGQLDRQTPFLGLIQGLSPQLKRDKEQYIAGAALGDVFNSVTRELYKPEDGVLVIPVLWQKVYNVWIDRDEGGGFLGSYRDPACTDPIFVSPVGAEGTDKTTAVVETVNWWVLARSADGTWLPAIVSMKVTQLKASRKWATLVTIDQNKHAPKPGVPAPMFLSAYKLASVGETNQSGEFYNWKAERVGFATPALIKAAAELLRLIRSGALKADPTKAAETDAAPAADAEAEEPAAGKKGRPKY